MSDSKPTEGTPLTWAQVKAAREAGPRMLDILAGWLVAESTLSRRASFLDKIKAANDLAGLHSSAEALIVRVMNAKDIS